MTDDADSDAEAEEIRVKPGSSRSSTIAAFFRAVDDYYARRPVPDLQVKDDTVDESDDIRADSSVGTSSDASEIDSGQDGETDDQGASDSQTIPLGKETDEGAPGDPDNPSEQAGGTDVEQTSVERDESEGGERESEQNLVGFHFAPAFHCRGDRID